MAKITVIEAVHVAATIEGAAIELDLIAGDNEVEQSIADLLITQGLATEAVSKSSASKKSSSADVVVEIPSSSEGEAN